MAARHWHALLTAELGSCMCNRQQLAGMDARCVLQLACPHCSGCAAHQPHSCAGISWIQMQAASCDAICPMVSRFRECMCRMTRQSSWSAHTCSSPASNSSTAMASFLLLGLSDGSTSRQEWPARSWITAGTAPAGATAANRHQHSDADALAPLQLQAAAPEWNIAGRQQHAPSQDILAEDGVHDCKVKHCVTLPWLCLTRSCCT